jgi:hypothetical protein
VAKAGSIIFGLHVGQRNDRKQSVLSFSRKLWDGQVFKPGSVTVEAHLEVMERVIIW